jgi:hypothetical protein
MSRRAPDGREIGNDYQKQCSASWRRAGFDVFSVNSTREIKAAPHILSLAKDLGIGVVQVDRDAMQVAGKPYVYVNDLLEVGGRVSNRGLFAIVNADITLAEDYDFVQAIRDRVEPGRFLLARRIGIDRPDGRVGPQYRTGFDFFAFHARDTELVPDIGLIFGNAWWDHYLPLVMCAEGCRSWLLPDPPVLHLEHEERWQGSHWTQFGQQFLDEVSTRLKSPLLASSVMARAYADALDKAVWPDTGSRFANLALRVRMQLPRYAKAAQVDMLSRVANANVNFLDMHSETGAATVRKLPQETAPAAKGKNERLQNET